MDQSQRRYRSLDQSQRRYRLRVDPPGNSPAAGNGASPAAGNGASPAAGNGASPAAGNGAVAPDPPADAVARPAAAPDPPADAAARLTDAAARPADASTRLTEAAARLDAIAGASQDAGDAVLRDDPKPPSAGSARWCSIVLKRTERGAEFQVLALGESGERRVVGRSDPIKLSRSGEARDRGQAKEAHEALTRQLVGAGWTPVGARGRWHDLAFVRSPALDGPKPRRLVIRLTREGQMGRFLADELDEYGNPTAVDHSDEFSLTPGMPDAPPTEEAQVAHQALLMKLTRAGWAQSGAPGPEWHSQTMVSGEPAQPTGGAVTAIGSGSVSGGFSLLDDLTKRVDEARARLPSSSERRDDARSA